MDEQQAAKVLADAVAERVTACQRGISELLALHRCDIEVEVLLRAGQVIPAIKLVARP